MVNPIDALVKFQQALDSGVIIMQPCILNNDIGVVLDEPRGQPRFTYAKVKDGKVHAIALIVMVEPHNNLPCFQIGYAVIESKRNKGIGGKIMADAINEFKNGMRNTPMKEFYFESFVSLNNEPSNKISCRLISDSPTQCVDQLSGESAYHYLKLVSLSFFGQK